MATAGTFFELAPLATDWAAGDLVVDGDTVERRAPLGDGFVTFLALLLGGDGGTSVFATDLPVGAPGSGVRVGGRWLPTDVDVAFGAADALEGVLQADDTSPVGTRLADVVTVPRDTVEDWGTGALGCLVPLDGPYDPDWLSFQLCGRDLVVGKRVVVVPEVAP